MNNRYPGKCEVCGKAVESNAGVIEKVGYGRRGHWRLWCQACFDRSDNASNEDRCCGNRAYEDACAAACGFTNY